MVKDTALIAINTGSKALIKGEFASVAEDMPNSEAMGLAHTPTQAPLLQHDNKIGAAEVSPPVIDAQNDFFAFILNLIFFLF
jgi:hypothetical protein